MRIGQSTDIHRLKEGETLIIGGVKLNHYKGTVAHSDGDVLYHAIAEAIIGALGLGDLGTFFPDNDDKYKNIDSSILMSEVYELMNSNGYKIGNIDSLVLIEKPKLFEYKQEMKENISKLLHCAISDVNVKATRGEKLGYIGNEEGVMAQAVVILKENV